MRCRCMHVASDGAPVFHKFAILIRQRHNPCATVCLCHNFERALEFGLQHDRVKGLHTQFATILKP